MEFVEDKINSLKGIYLKVGILANIEPQLLQSAYHAYGHDDERYHDVPLYVELTDIKIQCEVCNHITDVKTTDLFVKTANDPVRI